MSGDVIDMRPFLAHGILPEAGPLQPPEVKQPVAPDPWPLTEAEKLQAARKMARHDRYRKAALEALYESDSWELIVSGLLAGKDAAVGYLAREVIVEYLEAVAQKNFDQKLEDFL